MRNILSIDSTTEACSVAVLTSGSIVERYRLAPREHANLLLPFVEEVLAEAGLSLGQLDAIACCVGPGAFTGLRIGVSVAQGLAYGADKPVIAVSSLANLAQQMIDDVAATQVWAAIDARMNEVYFGVFNKSNQNLPVLVTDEIVVAPDAIDFATLNGDGPEINDSGFSLAAGENKHSKLLKLVGSGWQSYKECYISQYYDIKALIEKGSLDRFPRASASLAMAEAQLTSGLALSPEELQPVYLRNNVAKKKSVRL